MSCYVTVVSSSAALEGVTAHYDWCVVVCIVVDLLLIVVVDVGCVTSVSIVLCIVADGIFCAVSEISVSDATLTGAALTVESLTGHPLTGIPLTV